MYEYYYNSDGFLSHIDAYNKSDVQTDSFDYIWDGDKLIARKYYSHSDDEGLISQVVYDSDDEAIGFITYGFEADTVTYEDIYLYRKNLQGDVTGVIDGFTGELIGSFTYDAYGMPGFHPINDNFFSILYSALTFVMLPQVYRGYTFALVGNEVCYYLGSRFYSPRMGRFLNADKYTDTGTGVIGTNMYAYCNNNPVMFVDPTGENTKTKSQDQPLGIIEWFLAVYMAILTVLALPRSTVTTTSPLIESSKTKIPSKLKDGDKVKTPDTHPDEFEKIKGTDKYMHKKTKWEFKKDRLHNRDYWDARPRNGKTGDYHNINLDVTIL